MERNDGNDTARRPVRDAYEPPEVERVFDADELEREVQYAGFVPVSDP